MERNEKERGELPNPPRIHPPEAIHIKNPAEIRDLLSKSVNLVDLVKNPEDHTSVDVFRELFKHWAENSANPSK